MGRSKKTKKKSGKVERMNGVGLVKGSVFETFHRISTTPDEVPSCIFEVGFFFSERVKK